MYRSSMTKLTRRPCPAVIKWLIDKRPSKAIRHIQFLVFSYSYVGHAVVSILITYLTDIAQHFDVAATVTNVQEGLSAVMVIVVAHITDKYADQFKMIITTTLLYDLGLGLLCCSTWLRAAVAAWVFYGAALLIALGEAGREANLDDFLGNQYLSEQKKQRDCKDGKRLKSSRTQAAMWNIPWFLGAAAAFFPIFSYWRIVLLVSASLTAASCFWFWFAYPHYFINKKTLAVEGEQRVEETERGLSTAEEGQEVELCTSNGEETERKLIRCIDTEGGLSTAAEGQKMELCTRVLEETERGVIYRDDTELETHCQCPVAGKVCIETDQGTLCTEAEQAQTEEPICPNLCVVEDTDRREIFIDAEAEEERTDTELETHFQCPVEAQTDQGSLYTAAEQAQTEEILIDTEKEGSFCTAAEQEKTEELSCTNPCVEDIEERGEIFTGRALEFWTLRKLKEEMPFFKRIILMWLAFLIYGVVEATGSTFFYEQLPSNDNLLGNIAVYFSLISSASRVTVSFLYNRFVIPRKWRHATLVRIGCGMTCSLFCCLAAWLVEMFTLSSIKPKQLDVENDTPKTIPSIIFWLVPQFVLWGTMKGFAEEGLEDFLHEQVFDDNDERMVRYVPHITEFLLGTAKLGSVFSILAFKRRWFHESVNRSRLDLYYLVLGLASLVNLFYYVCAAHYYATNKSLKPAREEIPEQGAMELEVKK